MVHERFEFDMPAPREVVFDAFHYHRWRARWDSLVDATHVIGGAPCPYVGAITENSGGGMLRGLAMRTRFISFDRPRVAAAAMQGRSFPFVRQYRPQDHSSRAFGIGATDSFDIFPVGDSQTFSSIELILSAGGRIHYHRTSPGESYSNAKLLAERYIGSPFSLSSLIWNGNGWDLITKGGWTYQFPSSGPGRTWQQGALIGIHSDTGQTFAIQRNNSDDLREIRAPDGTSIDISEKQQYRLINAVSRRPQQNSRRLGQIPIRRYTSPWRRRQVHLLLGAQTVRHTLHLAEPT